ncbi:zinc-ribbon domain-containing protein [Pseudooceanicola sp.]|uniref:zinc-ribbon domain-containing protein n=1 Tax=Pseudooceanicola sp. TaxID=1914328 RepID=UPI00262385A8|nr:zinc-ribbon domain-containing protein [Pseudooceanicola sp.]MDF1855317.1 zinc-ribbon domain-containing protein [Pseudooceanicola sp.]
MRLVCPNCGAQYEVPTEVVPTEGRDVQCSNCGITWFQYHPDNTPETDEEAGVDEALDAASAGSEASAAAPDDEAGEDAAEYDAAAEADEAFDMMLSDSADDSDSYEDEDEDAFDAGFDGGFEGSPDDALYGADTEDAAPEEDNPGLDDLPPIPPTRRELKPEVKSVLQEEAAFNAKVRARAPDPLESQPDLGLGDPENEVQRRERESREHVAKLRGMPVPPPLRHPDASGSAVDGEAQVESRRELLPDIEEINSSLRTKDAEPERPPSEEVTDAREQRRSFRTGFGLVLLLTAMLVLIYLRADWIALKVPALADEVQTYVAVANDFRFWLDGQVGKLLVWLNEMSADG